MSISNVEKVKLVFRRKTSEFNSIENVFNSLLPFLNVEKEQLPFTSSGLKNKILNLKFAFNIKRSRIHITGHDHYLLAFNIIKRGVLTIHDIEILKRTTGIKRFILKKLWFDWPIRFAKEITTISKFSRMEIQKLGNYDKTIEVIYNPLSLKLKYTPKEFEIECPRILQIGAKKNKNVERLLKALEGVNCKLIIIGKPEEKLKKSIEESGVDCELLYNLKEEELINEYVKCDLVSFVSTYEGFGLPVIEAQAVGRPVITSKDSAMSEIANEGAILVDPYSIEEIEKGIKEIIENSNLRAELIQLGKENVQRFKPESIAEQYNKLYNRL